VGRESSTQIEFRQVSRSFRNEFFKGRVEAVKDVSFSVQRGEIYGLIGPNGSGKSTLMKMVLGLVRPSRGEIFVSGKNILDYDVRDLFGYLPENPYFSAYLSGEETLRYYSGLLGLRDNAQELKKRISHVANQVGIESALKRSVGGYSKGMLQRLGLAQALIGEPEVLILDEPTAGVDPQGTHDIREIILGLKSSGKTVLMCSHLLDQMQEISDHVGIMHQGEMVAEGSLNTLLEDSSEKQLSFKNLKEEEITIMKEALQKACSQAELTTVAQKRGSLEALYIKLTKTREAERL